MEWLAAASVLGVGVVSFLVGRRIGVRHCTRHHPPTWYERPEVAPENADQSVDRATYPDVFWGRHDHPASDVNWK